MKTKSSAFTLIELLTVIAIIGILGAIIIPAVSHVRKSSQAAKALSNIRQIGSAALLYSNENSGKFPGFGNDSTTNGMGLGGALYPYLESRSSDEWPTWPELKRTYYSIRDPRAPEEILKGGWQWIGVNGLFSNYPEPGSDGTKPKKKERRFMSFDQPSRVIYAATGNGNLTAELASNPEQLPIPEGVRQGFYFCHDGAVPAVFMDGHAEMMTFPIDPSLLDPDYSPQN